MEKYTKVITVVKLGKKKRERHRRYYEKKKLREKYILWLLLLEECKKRVKDYDEYQVHHKIPISLGGGNDFNNFVLLLPKDHVNILHNKIINPQIDKLEDGIQKNIIVPNFDRYYYLNHQEFIDLIDKFDKEYTVKKNTSLLNAYYVLTNER